MGYYTHHKVSWEPNNFQDIYLERLAEISQYNIDHFTGEGDSCKWHEREENMLQLSKEFLDIKFRVDGDGDGSNDIWVKWYHAGKLTGEWSAPQIIIPEGFDPPEI